MPDLEPPNLVRNLEQIAHEVFDIGNEREQQLRLRLPVGSAAVAARNSRSQALKVADLKFRQW